MIDDAVRPLADEYFVLWVMIAQTKDALLKARQRDYAQFGINNERRAVLWIIQNNGGQATPVEIARQLFRELHSVTEMLNRMTKEGLVRKVKSTGKSKTEAKLTKKGLEVFSQSLHNETDKRIFSALSKNEREQLMSCLWKVRKKALSELGIPEWQITFPLDPNGTNGEEDGE
jgi:DNA-binding MarR family transcriptional regulator